MGTWDKMDRSCMPDVEDISGYVRNPVWDELLCHITETYDTRPVFEYSRCAWPGWNVKFKKAGKNLCTVYPFEGYVWVLVVIGQKEKERFEEELLTMSSYMQNLYQDTQEGMGQRWLKIELEDMDMMQDVTRSIAIKRG